MVAGLFPFLGFLSKSGPVRSHFMTFKIRRMVQLEDIGVSTSAQSRFRERVKGRNVGVGSSSRSVTSSASAGDKARLKD